jgi:hypothetical protein
LWGNAEIFNVKAVGTFVTTVFQRVNRWNVANYGPVVLGFITAEVSLELEEVIQVA